MSPRRQLLCVRLQAVLDLQALRALASRSSILMMGCGNMWHGVWLRLRFVCNTKCFPAFTNVESSGICLVWIFVLCLMLQFGCRKK